MKSWCNIWVAFVLRTKSSSLRQESDKLEGQIAYFIIIPSLSLCSHVFQLISRLRRRCSTGLPIICARLTNIIFDSFTVKESAKAITKSCCTVTIVPGSWRKKFLVWERQHFVNSKNFFLRYTFESENFTHLVSKQKLKSFFTFWFLNSLKNLSFHIALLQLHRLGGLIILYHCPRTYATGHCSLKSEVVTK